MGGGGGAMPHFHAITTNQKLKGSKCPPPPSFCCWVYNKKNTNTYKQQEQ